MTSFGGTSIALYRKYRSATFAELIGQEHVTAPLSRALSSGRINHAYLFSGPRGCGKTSSARILARSLNCAQGPTATPCGVCHSCIELAPNGSGSIDVIEIDAASHNGVDDARDLRERAFFAPARDRYKVYILDEAHMVTTQGFNALLKLVEEPPDFVVFIFATTEPDKVLQTIRSRTHHYPFRLVPPSAMRAHLERICLAEGVTAEPSVLPLVVRAGGGSVRDSLSILDQLLAGAGDEGLTYARAVALLGVTDGALLDDIVDALAAGDASGVYGTIDRVVEAGHDPRRFAADLLDRFRDLILLDAVPDGASRGLIDAPTDTVAHMVDQAARIGAATLTRYAEIVHAALIEMRGTTSPRLVLELLCARMQLPDAAADSAALLQRIERLERRQSIGQAAASAAIDVAAAGSATGADAARNGASSTSARGAGDVPAASGRLVSAPPPPERPAETAPGQAETPPAPLPSVVRVASVAPEAAGTLDAVGLRRLWPEVLEAVKKSSRRTHGLLYDVQVAALDGNLVTLSLLAPTLARMLGEDSNTNVIRAALTQVLGGTWTVTVVVSADPAPAPISPAESSPQPPSPPSPPRTAAPPPMVIPRPPPPRPAQERKRADERVSGTSAPAEPESDPREDTEAEEPNRSAPRIDPEAAALRLLQSTLDARPIED